MTLMLEGLGAIALEARGPRGMALGAMALGTMALEVWP